MATGLGRSSNQSSQSASPDHASTSSGGYNFVRFPPDHRSELNSALPKRPPDIDKPGKVRLRGPAYVGPSLTDPGETSEEEADFERFKMEIRIKKIWEFHHLAAQADVELAMNIYNDRVTKTSSKAGDALKVAEHEKRMLRMQAAKEEERKEIVSAERQKRRDEIRRRVAQTAKALDVGGTQRSWDAFFDPQAAQIDFDERGRVIPRKEVVPVPGSSTEDHVWENPNTHPAVNGQDATLRGRPPTAMAKASGWKTKQVPSASSPWQTHTSLWQAEATSNNPLTHSSSDAEEWGLNYEGSFELPGGFPADAMNSSDPSSLNGWPKKPVGSSKLAQVEIASSPPDVAPEIPVADTSPFVPAGKKPNKKQRPAAQKKGNLTPAFEAESPTTPTLAPKYPVIQQKLVHPDEELSSTPRPHLPAGHIKRSPALTSGYMSDATSTLKASTRRFASQLSADESMIGSSSKLGDEMPWQRAQRLGTLPSGGAAASGLVMSNVEEESLWAAGVRQKGQQTTDSRPVQNKASPLGGFAEEPGSLWERTMKSKVQASLVSAANSNIPQPSDVLEGESPWQRMMRLKGQSVNSPHPSHDPNQTSTMVGDESPWEQMNRPKNQSGSSTSVMVAPAPALEEETPWQRMQRLKAQGGNTGSAIVQSMSISEQTNGTEDETPWQRMARHKSQGSNSTVPSSLSSKMQGPSGPVKMTTMNQPWGSSAGVEPFASHRTEDMAWSHNGNASRSGRQSGWGSSPQAAGNSWKDPLNPNKAFAAGGKKVTIEDVPDEEGPNGWKGPEGRLPSNSRIILDIAEPKPSVPSTMFENIFLYEGADEGPEEEYDTGLSSAAPTPSTAPTSPPSDEPIDEGWYMSAMEEMGKGNWDNLLKKGVPVPSETSSRPKNYTGPAISHMNDSPSLSQSIDSAKLLSALEAVDERPTPARSSPPKASVEPPVPRPVEGKKEPVKPPPAPAPAKEVKGKGKKGKGRK
jgi:hypothetical protein